jgi:hypothetical protein
MKTCRIWGDLDSDRVDEQYPVVNYCDECYEELKDVEDCILQEIEFDPDYGPCHKCGKSYEEEQKEYQEKQQENEVRRRLKMLTFESYKKVIECLSQTFKDIMVTIESGKIIIARSDYISEWYNNIHIAIWKQHKNYNISIDAGFEGHPNANKENIQQNKKFLEENQELFEKAGYEFAPTGSGFKLCFFHIPNDFIEGLIRILEVVYLLIKIYKEYKRD